MGRKLFKFIFADSFKFRQSSSNPRVYIWFTVSCFLIISILCFYQEYFIVGMFHLLLAAYCYVKRSNFYYSFAYQAYLDGNSQETLASLDLAILTNPENADAYYLRGIFAYECENFTKAIADLNQAVQYKPSNIDAFYYRGLCYGQRHLIEHRFPEAIEDFSESIRLQPDRAHAYQYRGHTNIYQGNLEAALADFSDFIRLQPKSFGGYYNRAVSVYNLGRFQEVLADLTQSIAIDPNHTPSYYGRSNTYIQLNRLEEAIVDFERAQELEPNYPIDRDDQHAFYHAGVSHHHQGHSQVALEYLNQALRLCSQHHDNSMHEIVASAIQSLET
jgi:tetratricopeptide (TPR) repeat protein